MGVSGTFLSFPFNVTFERGKGENGQEEDEEEKWVPTDQSINLQLNLHLPDCISPNAPRCAINSLHNLAILNSQII